MNLIAYGTKEKLIESLTDLIEAGLRERLETGARASLCVPGGTTPGPVFEALSHLDLDWSRVNVLLNDERWVPESHARSNTALLKRTLLQNRASKAQLTPLYCDRPTPEEGLPSLMDGVASLLPLTVVLLGMGADMHTASLFPGADKLELGLSPAAPHLLAMRAEGAPEPRITLSANALKTAAHIHVMITGAEKKTAYERALTLSEREAPIAAFLPSATVHWTA